MYLQGKGNKKFQKTDFQKKEKKVLDFLPYL